MSVDNADGISLGEWQVPENEDLHQVGSGRDLALTEHDESDLPGVLIFDLAGRLVSLTPNAAGFLQDLGAIDARWREGQDLPLPVQVVLGALDQTLLPATTRDRRRVPRLRVRALSGRWLTLHAALTEPTVDRPSERIVVVGPAQAGDIAWFAVGGYELSERARDVVRLLVRGLSTMQNAGQQILAGGRRQRVLVAPDPGAIAMPNVPAY